LWQPFVQKGANHIVRANLLARRDRVTGWKATGRIARIYMISLINALKPGSIWQLSGSQSPLLMLTGGEVSAARHYERIDYLLVENTYSNSLHFSGASKITGSLDAAGNQVFVVGGAKLTVFNLESSEGKYSEIWGDMGPDWHDVRFMDC